MKPSTLLLALLVPTFASANGLMNLGAAFKGMQDYQDRQRGLPPQPSPQGQFRPIPQPALEPGNATLQNATLSSNPYTGEIGGWRCTYQLNGHIVYLFRQDPCPTFLDIQ